MLDRTIITAAFRPREAGQLHDDTSGDRMDLKLGTEPQPFRSRRFQL